MHLRDYLSATPKSEWPAFAQKVGTSAGYLIQMIGGFRTPRLPLIDAIERATDGQVTRYDWPVPRREKAQKTETARSPQDNPAGHREAA